MWEIKYIVLKYCMKLKFWCKYIYENCILLGIVSNIS